MKNIAIIGCGRISKNHIIAIFKNSDISRLVAVCDIVEDKATVRAKEYSDMSGDMSVKIYTDFRSMLRLEQIDIVGIATESGYHYEQVKYCLENKINVLVEKPMALKIEHAEEMIKLAAEKNVNLGVCHQNRFNPPIQELKRVIREGKFGKIYAVSANIYWSRDKNYYEQAPWRGTYNLDGGALMNQCIHNIDLLQWVVDSKPMQINAMLSNYNHKYLEVEDYGSIQIRFENGVIGNIQGTVAVYPKNYKETLTIFGEKGSIEIGGLAVNEIKHWIFEDKEETLDKVVGVTSKQIENIYGNGHTPLYRDFICSIDEKRKSYISGEEGIKALKIILNAYRIEGIENE